MTLNLFRTGVPCAICGTRIASWDAYDTAQPCGHTLDEILTDATVTILTVPRVRLGQYADEGAA